MSPPVTALWPLSPLFFQISNSIINPCPHKYNLGEHITLERTSNLPLRMVPCYSTIFSAYHCAVKKRVLLFRSHETCTTKKTPSFRTTVDCRILPPLLPSTPFPLARPHTPYTIPRHSTGHLQCISSWLSSGEVDRHGCTYYAIPNNKWTHL